MNGQGLQVLQRLSQGVGLVVGRGGCHLFEVGLKSVGMRTNSRIVLRVDLLVCPVRCQRERILVLPPICGGLFIRHPYLSFLVVVLPPIWWCLSILLVLVHSSVDQFRARLGSSRLWQRCFFLCLLFQPLKEKNKPNIRLLYREGVT